MSDTKRYTRDGSYPAPLPFRIRLKDGRTRTDPTSFTLEEIADAGYIPAPEEPQYDPATQRINWDGSDWIVSDLPPVVISYMTLNKLEAIELFRSVTGKGDIEELAMRKDPALELLWMKWETDVPQSIHRDNPVVGVFLDGLIAAGHATAEHKAAMLDAWPTQ